MKRLAGYAIAFCGAILLFPGLPLKAVSRIRVLNIGVLFYLIGTIMVWLGRRLFIEGKLSALPAELLLARDKRLPVLYLRSFELEPLANQALTRSQQGPAAVSMDLDVHTQEEILSKTLKRVGPCIAVGDPRSEQVVLGFSRLKLGDDWKERVQDLIKQCTLVVHCAGGTPGLLWELEQVAQLVVPRSKLLLIITPTITQEWWALADRLFGSVPRFTVSGNERQAYIAVIQRVCIRCILCLKCSFCNELRDNCGTNLDQAYPYATKPLTKIYDRHIPPSYYLSTWSNSGWSLMSTFDCMRDLFQEMPRGIRD